MYEEMTLKGFYRVFDNEIDTSIIRALSEDKVYNDITTNTLLKGGAGEKITSAILLCKEDCIVSGLEIFKRVYKNIDPKVYIKLFYKDGDKIRNKQAAGIVKSSLKILLKGERTALNYLQRMSGIATLTNKYVKQLKFKESAILHTRKTTPNFRVFEIAAVKTGGGDFHRFNLGSSIMVKDNHIEACGSLQNAMQTLSKKGAKSKRLEVEVKNMNELLAVVRYGKKLVEIVMLDNFKESMLPHAVKILKNNGFRVEISGGINEKNFRNKQVKGIDYYSIGALTHSYKSADFSLEF
jgi:nicotinate-nucleotide pyrophosphorylase (carboxylating)